MNESLEEYSAGLEALAHKLGLDYYPVDFELAPESLMTEIAVYGLPVRMPHWSFGVRYIHQLVRQSMGHSRIFEVMFPGDPCHAYLMDGNTIAENTLVTAHVLGHADFSKNNALFARFHEQAGANIIEMAAAHAHRIQQAIDECGVKRVEAVLDAALALESHVDMDRDLHRDCTRRARTRRRGAQGRVPERFQQLPEKQARGAGSRGRRRSMPFRAPGVRPAVVHRSLRGTSSSGALHLAFSARRTLYFTRCSPADHERGLASYWHARCWGGGIPAANALPLPIKAHSDVVRPFAADEQTALSATYHLGFPPGSRSRGSAAGRGAPHLPRRGRLRLRAQLSRPHLARS